MLAGREADQTREGEFRAVVLGGDLVGLRVEHVAAPDDQVAVRVAQERDHGLREQRLPREGARVVVLGRDQNDQQELEVLLGQVQGLREPALEERDPRRRGALRVSAAAVSAVFLVELAPEPRRGVPRGQHPAASAGYRGGAAAPEPAVVVEGGEGCGERAGPDRRGQERQDVHEGAEERRYGPVPDVEGSEEQREEKRRPVCWGLRLRHDPGRWLGAVAAAVVVAVPGLPRGRGARGGAVEALL